MNNYHVVWAWSRTMDHLTSLFTQKGKNEYQDDIKEKKNNRDSHPADGSFAIICTDPRVQN